MMISLVVGVIKLNAPANTTNPAIGGVCYQQ